jgi:hypothetical protein
MLPYASVMHAGDDADDLFDEFPVDEDLDAPDEEATLNSAAPPSSPIKHTELTGPTAAASAAASPTASTKASARQFDLMLFWRHCVVVRGDDT